MVNQRIKGIIVFAICIVCYYNSCHCGFVFDDISAIKENRDLRPHTPLKNIFYNDFWGTPMHKEQSHKSYRPLCVLTFRWNYYFHQLEPLGYHLVNVLLHAIVCLMYMRVCSMFLHELPTFIATVFFAIHPIHTEAVTGVVGRAETLSSVFFLGAFLLYARAARKKNYVGWRSLLLGMVCVAIAMLCKEQGITVTAICAVYEIFFVQKLRLRDLWPIFRWLISGKPIPTAWSSQGTKRLLFLILTTVGLLSLRMQVMGSRLPIFTRFDNPASVAPSPSKQLSYIYLFALNIWLLLFPCDLCCDWTMGTVPLIASFTDYRNLTTIFMYSSVGYLIYTAARTTSRQKGVVIIMSLAFMVLPFIPASNIFFPVGFVVAERVLYMPSMGFCMLMAYGWFQVIVHRIRKVAWFGLALLIVSHSCKTYLRNWDWETEYSIFMAGLRVNQRNAKLFNNVGHALEAQARYDEALQYFHKAVSVQPDDIGAHINVGRTYNHLKMFKEAEEAYLKAKALLPKAKPGESYQARIAPNHLNVFLNLANLIAKNETRLEEADLLYRQAISMRADYTQAYINRGDVLLKLNRTKEAQEVYERALFYDSNNPDIYYNLGVVFLEQGKASQALAYLDKALEFDPEHEQALLNSAILLQELGRAELRKVARERLLKLLQKDTNNERVHFNLGMLAMDDRDLAGAEHWFRRAIQIKPDFRSALFNLALMLADDNRPLEAAPFLNQLVRFHPDHVKGLILLGDIYINHIKDLDAAENCYKRILELEPTNIQGVHNLCVVHVERGALESAEVCLKKAHIMAPNEDYVLRHLAIVQARIASGIKGIAEIEQSCDASDRPENYNQQESCDKKENPEEKKEEQLGGKEEQLGEKEEQLGEKKEQLGEKEEQLGEKKEQLGEKKEQLGEKKEQLGEKKEQQGKKEKQLSEKRDENKEQHEDKKEQHKEKTEYQDEEKGNSGTFKDQSDGNKEQYGTFKEHHEVKNERPGKKKEQTAEKKEQTIKKKEQSNKKKDQLDKKKDQPVKKKDQLDKKKDQPVKKKDQLDKKKDQLDKKKDQPVKKKDQLDKKKDQPVKKKDQLDKKKDQPVKKKEPSGKKKSKQLK